MVAVKNDTLGVVVPMPVRTTTVVIEGDNYPGYTAVMRTNPRRSVLDDLKSQDIGRVSKAVSTLVQSWNYLDEQGAAIDHADPQAVYDLPDDLLAATLTGYFASFAEATAVPKLLTTPSGAS